MMRSTTRKIIWIQVGELQREVSILEDSLVDLLTALPIVFPQLRLPLAPLLGRDLDLQQLVPAPPPRNREQQPPPFWLTSDEHVRRLPSDGSALILIHLAAPGGPGFAPAPPLAAPQISRIVDERRDTEMLRPSERVRPRERSAERDAGKLRSGEQKRGEREARDLQRVADRAAAEQEPRVPSGGAQIRSSAHSQQTRRDDDRDRDEFDMQHWRHVCLLRGLPFESQVEDVVQFIKPVSRDLQPIFDVVLCHCVRKGRTALLGTAFVRLKSKASVEDCVRQLHRQTIGQRFIEVFAAEPSDVRSYLGQCSLHPGAGTGRGGPAVHDSQSREQSERSGPSRGPAQVQESREKRNVRGGERSRDFPAQPAPERASVRNDGARPIRDERRGVEPPQTSYRERDTGYKANGSSLVDVYGRGSTGPSRRERSRSPSGSVAVRAGQPRYHESGEAYNQMPIQRAPLSAVMPLPTFMPMPMLQPPAALGYQLPAPPVIAAVSPFVIQVRPLPANTALDEVRFLIPECEVLAIHLVSDRVASAGFESVDEQVALVELDREVDIIAALSQPTRLLHGIPVYLAHTASQRVTDMLTSAAASSSVLNAPPAPLINHHPYVYPPLPAQLPPPQAQIIPPFADFLTAQYQQQQIPPTHQFPTQPSSMLALPVQPRPPAFPALSVLNGDVPRVDIEPVEDEPFAAIQLVHQSYTNEQLASLLKSYELPIERMWRKKKAGAVGQDTVILQFLNVQIKNAAFQCSTLKYGDNSPIRLSNFLRSQVNQLLSRYNGPSSAASASITPTNAITAAIQVETEARFPPNASVYDGYPTQQLPLSVPYTGNASASGASYASSANLGRPTVTRNTRVAR